MKWNSPQGEIHGEVRVEVRRKSTSSADASGREVDASDDDPRYVIEGKNSGNEAAREPDSLSEAQE